MTENERVRQVRKSAGLTMERFGAKIGMGRSSISDIESGRRTLTNQSRLSICREFGVNEEWLRNGMGEMFSSEPASELQAIFDEYKTPPRTRILVERILNLPPILQGPIVDYVLNIAARLSGQPIDSMESASETGKRGADSETDEERLKRYEREARAEADEIYEEILQEKLAADATEAFGQSSGGMSA